MCEPRTACRLESISEVTTNMQMVFQKNICSDSQAPAQQLFGFIIRIKIEDQRGQKTRQSSQRNLRRNLKPLDSSLLHHIEILLTMPFHYDKNYSDFHTYTTLSPGDQG